MVTVRINICFSRRLSSRTGDRENTDCLIVDNYLLKAYVNCSPYFHCRTDNVNVKQIKKIVEKTNSNNKRLKEKGKKIKEEIIFCDKFKIWTFYLTKKLKLRYIIHR